MADESLSPKLISYKEAKSLGLKCYFTGTPCKRGHVAERDVSSCSCVTCRDERSRAWYLANPERGQANRDRWRAANREKDLTAKRAYAARNQEQLKKKNATYYRENITKYRAWLADWKRSHPIHQIVYSQNRRVRIRGYEGKGITVAHYEQMLDEQMGRCAYCGEEKKLSLDHVWALVRGGRHEPQNCVLACRPCNLKKLHAPLDIFLVQLAKERPGLWTATLADISRILMAPWRHQPYEVKRQPYQIRDAGLRIGQRIRRKVA